MRSPITQVIQDTSAHLTWKGDYSSTTTYSTGDIVSYADNLWLAVYPQLFNNQIPNASTTYWKRVSGNGGETAEGAQILQPVVVDFIDNFYFDPTLGSNAYMEIRSNESVVNLINLSPGTMLLTIKYLGEYSFKFTSPVTHPLKLPITTPRFAWQMVGNSPTNKTDIITFIVPASNNQINGVLNVVFTEYTAPF